MLKPYDGFFNDEDISADTCEALTGYNFEQLLSLTGVLSVINFRNLIKPEINGEYPFIYLIVKTQVVTLKRTIDLRNRTIANDYMHINPCGIGIGLTIFCSQISNARKAGLKEITCVALKSRKHNGYITWAKLGFTMNSECLIDYYEFLEKHHRPKMNLFKLLEKEYEFWETFGYDWDGIFGLLRTSPNHEFLKTYILRKIKENGILLDRINKARNKGRIQLVATEPSKIKNFVTVKKERSYLKRKLHLIL